MTSGSPRDDLAEVIRRLEDDAYRRGWADAMQHVVSAARNGPAGETSEEASPRRKQRKVGYGAVREVIESAVVAFGDYGVTPLDVIEHGREVFNEDFRESSVRGALNRMTARRELCKQAGRWFRAQTSEVEIGGEETEDAESADWFGGHDVAA